MVRNGRASVPGFESLPLAETYSAESIVNELTVFDFPEAELTVMGPAVTFTGTPTTIIPELTLITI